MEVYEMDLITEAERLALVDPVEDFMVFQTDETEGVYQYNINGTWDYIGGRPPKR